MLPSRLAPQETRSQRTPYAQVFFTLCACELALHCFVTTPYASVPKP